MRLTSAADDLVSPCPAGRHQDRRTGIREQFGRVSRPVGCNPLRGVPGDEAGNPSPIPSTGNGQNGFPDLRLSVPPDLAQIDMRQVGHLVGRHDRIDDPGPSQARASAIVDRSFSGSSTLKPRPPQAWAKAAKSGLGNWMPFSNGARPTDSASRWISPKAELL